MAPEARANLTQRGLGVKQAQQQGEVQLASVLAVGTPAIGQREVIHITRSRTRRPGDWFASMTRSEQVRIEPAVMSSEIERLPDLEGYLKLASTPDWHQVKFAPRSIAPGRPTFFIPSAPPPPATEGPPGFGVVPDTTPVALPPTPTSSSAPKRRVPGKRVHKQGGGSAPNASA